MASTHRTTDFTDDRRPPAGFAGPRGRPRYLSWTRLAAHRDEQQPRPPETTRRIGHVEVCVATLDTALQRIVSAVDNRAAGAWGFCNAHTVNMARKLPHFRGALRFMTLFNDGVGVDLASRLLYGSRFPENLNGTDLTPALLRRLPAGTAIFLLGGAPSVADSAAERIRMDYPNVAIAGTQHGFFALQEEEAIIRRIAASDARLVLVAMGHPRQEIWAAWARNELHMPLLCVGAFLDFASGKVSRAPALIRRLRLEWVFRLALEPRRLAKRYLIGNVLFVACTLLQRLRQGRP